jgi:hypothetical protein
MPRAALIQDPRLTGTVSQSVSAIAHPRRLGESKKGKGAATLWAPKTLTLANLVVTSSRYLRKQPYWGVIGRTGTRTPHVRPTQLEPPSHLALA